MYQKKSIRFLFLMPCKKEKANQKESSFSTLQNKIQERSIRQREMPEQAFTASHAISLRAEALDTELAAPVALGRRG